MYFAAKHDIYVYTYIYIYIYIYNIIIYITYKQM